jgi:hypothetical protein
MRLRKLENGFGLLQKIPIGIIKTLYGIVPGPIAVMSYRRELFGRYLADCCQEGMRGGSAWKRGEVELFAAFVSKLNDCRF